jgi:hypothetical protein
MTVLVTSCRLMSGGQTRSSCSMAYSYKVTGNLIIPAAGLARMFHELLAATADMAVLPGVLGCRTLRRTVQVRLGSNTMRFPGGTSIFTVSRQQFIKHPG